MAKEPNLKINVGADTSDFDRGAKAVKQGLKDLDKVGTGALDSLGNAFGVNTGKITQMVSALKGLGQEMTKAGDAGVKAFGNVLKSITPLAGAVAGIGFGAAVAGFKALQNEAEAFRQTVEGANLEMATAAYIDTYRQVLRDFRGDFGKTVAEAESGFKKFFGTIGANFGAMFSTGANWKGFLPGGQAYGAQGMADYLRQIQAANARANDAAYLTAKINELEFQRKQLALDVAKIQDQIADKMAIARDTQASVTERERAMAEINDLVAKKKELTVPIEQKLAKLYEERSALATDEKTAAEETLAQKTRQYEISRAETMESNSLLRLQNSIANSAAKEAESRRKSAEEMRRQQAAMEAVRSRYADMATAIGGAGIATPGVIAPGLGLSVKQEQVEYFKETLQAYFGDWELAVGIKADASSIIDLSEELKRGLSNLTAQTSEMLGNLVGTLVAGGDAWGDFKNAALSAFGDMAIAIGKVAINAGFAVSGIQLALDSGQWYLAVAAGAALVALGSAVKSSLKSIASGDYSAGGGGYSGSYSAGGNGGGYETREVYVNVNGTLQADGDQLIAVINSTNKRNYYTQ
jgi:hypothetical protein